MNYADFICFVKREMEARLGEDVQVMLQSVLKNNSVVLDGLSFREKGKNIAPTIYLKEFYEEYHNGMTMPEILDYIEEMYNRNKLEEPLDTDFYLDYDVVKKNLACKLIHREKNKELLKNVPYLPFLDLAIVCYYRMEHESVGCGTIQVLEKHRKGWGVSQEELFRTARMNTPKILPPIYMNLHEILNMEDELACELSRGVPMYILTNSENCFGAVEMIYDSVLQEAGRYLQGDFWILPSSVHECILVPGSIQNGKRELEAMVRQVNEQEVSPEDYLSDSVYYYRLGLHKLEKV